MSVRAVYEAELKTRGYQPDPAQLRGIAALERCATEWSAYKEQRSNAFKKLINRPAIPRGVYMHGGVGRGKSFLMDCFFQAVPVVRKTRLHFHEFMREVHRELAELQGTVNPLDALGARIAKRYRLICFDEFHVADITDAMILHRLLVALFDNGVGFVTPPTSARRPLPNGLHRDRILPAIELLNAKLEGAQRRQRHRLPAPHHGAGQLYHTPWAPRPMPQMNDAFTRLAEAHDEDPMLHIEHREIRSRRKAGGRGLVRLQDALRRPRARRTTTWRSPPSSTPCC
jgi:cell division protein ZapE